MIYLWVQGEGWKEFELTDTEALKERGISIDARVTISAGAFIGAGATIRELATIGAGAFIGERATINARATIGRGATIHKGATINAGAFIGEGAFIDVRATIGIDATVGRGATIKARAFIGRGAVIGDYEKPTCIYITGTEFPVSYWGEDRIDIGCESLSINDWLGKEGKKQAAKENFSETEIAEYKRYIKFIKQVHEASNPTADKGEA